MVRFLSLARSFPNTRQEKLDDSPVEKTLQKPTCLDCVVLHGKSNGVRRGIHSIMREKIPSVKEVSQMRRCH